jgi:hypothetical protein
LLEVDPTAFVIIEDMLVFTKDPQLY